MPGFNVLCKFTNTRKIFSNVRESEKKVCGKKKGEKSSKGKRKKKLEKKWREERSKKKEEVEEKEGRGLSKR